MQIFLLINAFTLVFINTCDTVNFYYCNHSYECTMRIKPAFLDEKKIVIIITIINFKGPKYSRSEYLKSVHQGNIHVMEVCSLHPKQVEYNVISL